MPGSPPRAEFHWKHCREKNTLLCQRAELMEEGNALLFPHYKTVQLTKQESACHCFSQSLWGAAVMKWLDLCDTGKKQLDAESCSRVAVSKARFRSPFWFQGDYFQLEKEAHSNHFERNCCLKAEKETVLGWDRKNLHLREGKGKGEERSTALGLHQTALSISDPDGATDRQIPHPFTASRSSSCSHHIAALRTEWQAVISSSDSVKRFVYWI